ncbi:MAG: hypothetical protein Q7J32_02750 [Sphingomonadaceae bacterium]|nr:hypothetical protein [Sphingomonadaceae bacterium]
MNNDEAFNAELDRLSVQMNAPAVLEWRTARKEAGRILDPDAADVVCLYVETADPYGFCAELPKGTSCVARGYFARAVGSEMWVVFSDLPEATVERLWQRINAGDFDAAEQESNGLALPFGQVRGEVQRALDCHFGAVAFQIDEFKQLADGRFQLVIREDCSRAD